MARPDWFVDFKSRSAINRAKYGATHKESNPTAAQIEQQSLALDVLLEAAKYLRQRKPVPAALADYLADAIENTANTAMKIEESGNQPLAVGAQLLKELNFTQKAVGHRPKLRGAQVHKIQSFLIELSEGNREHVKSQKEIADKFGVSLKTVQRIWREMKE